MEEIYILISKYLLGTADSHELEQLKEWRCSGEGKNEREFQELCESWDLAHLGTSQPIIPDKEKVWEKIVNNLLLKRKLKMYTRRFLYRVSGIAAGVALILGFLFSILLSSGEDLQFVTFTAPAGQKAEVSLPDGTKVWLNSGSTLTYATDYGIDQRSVKLEGQALFDVVKNSKKQFCVLVGGVKVLVYGTVFDINGYTDSPELEVVLIEGHVTVLSASTDKLLADMKPNQKAVIPFYDTGKCRLLACDAQEEALWRLGKLKIEDQELPEVIRKMEKWYGVKIHLNDIPDKKRYWLTIKTESLTEMLEIINRITPISYTINGEEVTIIGRK